MTAELDALLPAQCRRDYEPERVLARGGYGVVVLATQRALNRPAVVKVLHAGALADAQQVERFQAEARITAALSHPAIVKLYDHGIDGGVPWFACEYVPGTDLRDLCDRGPLPLARAVEVAQQVCEALGEAHRRGVLHRDVKPENVLLDEQGNAKLADFGIAKWEAREHVQTADGQLLGTPAYVSPEQVRGGAAGPASDRYALGVMLFEMLTGTQPFTGDEPVRVLAAHATQPAPRVVSLRPDAGRELDALVDRLLAKDPAKRPDGAEVIRELKAVRRALPDAGAAPRRVATSPGRTHVASRAAPPREAPRRHRTLAAAAAAGLTAAALLAFAARPARRAEPPPSAPPTAWSGADEDAVLADIDRLAQRDLGDMPARHHALDLALGAGLFTLDLDRSAALASEILDAEQSISTQLPGLYERLDRAPAGAARSDRLQVGVAVLARVDLNSWERTIRTELVGIVIKDFKARKVREVEDVLSIPERATRHTFPPAVVGRVQKFLEASLEVLRRASAAPQTWQPDLGRVLLHGGQWFAVLMKGLRAEGAAQRDLQQQVDRFLQELDRLPPPGGPAIGRLAHVIWRRGTSGKAEDWKREDQLGRVAAAELAAGPLSPSLHATAVEAATFFK